MLLPWSALALLGLVSAASASAFIPVTGVLGDAGLVDGSDASGEAVPLRRSITELAAESGPQWDLYLQALRAMYDKDPGDPESFFAIAGIHGRPFVEWNNAGPMKTDGWGGYSTHGENLFIIWHRPFLVLFEQTLVREAKNIAADYPDQYRAIYQKAAKHLRAPYWDWALEPWLPPAVLNETVQVNAATETGTAERAIQNPLFTYRFPMDARRGKFGPFSTLDRMYRCKNSTAANENFRRRDYRSWLYNTFARSKSFSEFATTGSSGGSLEAVHNAVHWDAGCGGQFLDSQYSAFEPLFMLHHSNVDRLWAYWQAIYPDQSTFDAVYQCRPRFSTLGGTLTDLNSPLQPFRRSNGDWHTPASVNSIRAFGYTYSGLEYWSKSDKEMRKSAIETIVGLYGPASWSNRAAVLPNTTSTASSSTTSGTSQTQSTNAGHASSSLGPETATSLSNGLSTLNTGLLTLISTSALPQTGTAAMPTEAPVSHAVDSLEQNNEPVFNSMSHGDDKTFFASITVNVSELPYRPSSIEISIDEWLAGSMVVMQMPETGTLHDSIPLAGAIEAAHLDGLSYDEMLTQIISRLHVTLRKPDGSSIDMAGARGLQVRVEEVDILSLPTNLNLPQMSTPKAHEVVEAPPMACAAPRRSA